MNPVFHRAVDGDIALVYLDVIITAQPMLIFANAVDRQTSGSLKDQLALTEKGGTLVFVVGRRGIGCPIAENVVAAVCQLNRDFFTGLNVDRRPIRIGNLDSLQAQLQPLLRINLEHPVSGDAG